MSFTFNFDLSDEECDSGTLQGLVVNSELTPRITNGHEDQNVDGSVGHAQPLPAVEITEFCCEDITSQLVMKTMQFGDMHLNVVDTSTMEQKLLDDHEVSRVLKSSDQLIDAITSQTDLVTGVYEGGLKIWECGIDLVEFLSSHPVGVGVDFKGKSVLELGCGAGLPGLYCYKCGASQVDFQDYNEEVLKLLTHTNVINSQRETDAPLSLCRYFAGDWSSFSRLAMQNNLNYDFILTAETIYNTDNYPKLHDVFNNVLADDGTIFLAAKSYYFGVGGSVDTFIEYVRNENCFSVDVVHSLSKGVQRKILKLQRLFCHPSKMVK